MKSNVMGTPYISLDNWFTTVEIEVNSRCNRSCSYCPVSVLPKPNVPKFMDITLFNHIISELQRIKFSGRLSYHFYNEPLLRKDLEVLVRIVKLNLPNVYQVLYTNGDILTEERYEALINNGVDLIFITSHSMKIFPERERQEVQYPSDLILTNRGGLLSNLPKSHSDIQALPCHAPSEMLIITANGNVVLCYEDAERKHIMGNINKQSIEDIWFSSQFIEVRNRLKEEKGRLSYEICTHCTNTGHCIQGLSHIPT